MLNREKDSNSNSPFRGTGGIITERLLQFIWQFQHFSRSNLTTINGEPVQIQFAGQYNTNQGPDFLNAQITIAKTKWAGSVELHLKTSDWQKHKHEQDSNYKNVILHVVWQHDVTLHEHLPVLELSSRVSKILLQRYEELMQTAAFIPCHNMISSISSIVFKSWKERLLAERLTRKSNTVKNYLEECNYHWEEVFWWMLAKNFGIKVNAESFEAVAKSIPVNILAKHKNQIHQLEALLFGQAGLLQKDFTEDYPLLLQREYKFLAKKYSLQPVNMPVHFLRMRPGNFPTIRLAQLAMLVCNASHLFSKIKEAATVKAVKELLDVTANDYWHYHYSFDEASSYKKKKLGNVMLENIIINTIAPVLFAYGIYHDDDVIKQKVLQWLQELLPEKNSITKGFENIAVENKTAYDSQALIELKNEYCNKKRCLNCAVGNALLKA